MKKALLILSVLALSVNSYGQNWADSIFYSDIRPDEELKFQTLYTDTLEYLEYDEKETSPTEEIVTEETTNEKSFKVSYPSGSMTKYTVIKIGLELDEPIICVEFWAERYRDGEWRFATSDYYYLYYKENNILKIEKPGLSDNLLEDNPCEWVIAFRKFANEVPSMLDGQTENVEKIRELLWDSGLDITIGAEAKCKESDITEVEAIKAEATREDSNIVEVESIEAEATREDSIVVEVVSIEVIEVNKIPERRKHWKTGEFLDEIETKKIIIPLPDEELEIREGRNFPCIVLTLRGRSSYFEIKRRNEKYVIWDKQYDTINGGIEDYLKNSFFKKFYKDEGRWQHAWDSFVREDGLQKVIDFINEIIDDEFLDSPLNTTYG